MTLLQSIGVMLGITTAVAIAVSLTFVPSVIYLCPNFFRDAVPPPKQIEHTEHSDKFEKGDPALDGGDEADERDSLLVPKTLTAPKVAQKYVVILSPRETDYENRSQRSRWIRFTGWVLMHRYPIFITMVIR